jgi:DNA-directed RNA polymerase specialized sigma24 family protein
VTTFQLDLSDREGYELFRRAIVERSNEAWSAIYFHYCPRILGWSRQYCAKLPGDETAEDLAHRAIARAWQALGAEQFAQFGSLGALLAYLRSCVSAAVIDASRTAITRERAYRRLEVRLGRAPEQEVLHRAMVHLLWKQVFELVSSEHERVVVDEAFVLALRPRQIFARHQDLFANVALVYSVKRNLLSRLERSSELRQLYEEFRA